MERTVLIDMLRKEKPLLAEAVRHMTDYVTDRYFYPSKITEDEA
jgi:hypothetical protein